MPQHRVQEETDTAEDQAPVDEGMAGKGQAGNRSLDDSREAMVELRMTRIRSVSSRWRMQKPTSSAGRSSR